VGSYIRGIWGSARKLKIALKPSWLLDFGLVCRLPARVAVSVFVGFFMTVPHRDRSTHWGPQLAVRRRSAKIRVREQLFLIFV
jgi:hypothetical protein